MLSGEVTDAFATMHFNVPLMLQPWMKFNAHCMQSKALLPVLFACTEAEIKKILLLTGLPRLDLCTTYCIFKHS